MFSADLCKLEKESPNFWKLLRGPRCHSREGLGQEDEIWKFVLSLQVFPGNLSYSFSDNRFFPHSKARKLRCEQLQVYRN